MYVVDGSRDGPKPEQLFFLLKKSFFIYRKQWIQMFFILPRTLTFNVVYRFLVFRSLVSLFKIHFIHNTNNQCSPVLFFSARCCLKYFFFSIFCCFYPYPSCIKIWTRHSCYAWIFVYFIFGEKSYVCTFFSTFLFVFRFFILVLFH